MLARSFSNLMSWHFEHKIVIEETQGTAGPVTLAEAQSTASGFLLTLRLYRLPDTFTRADIGSAVSPEVVHFEPPAGAREIPNIRR